MTLLSKDAILGADDLPTRDITVPEWGGDVRVRGLTGRERDRFEMSIAAAQKGGSGEVDLRAPIVGRCLVDEEGNRLFTDKELGRLAAKSGAVLDRLFDVVRQMSGMDAGQVEADVENFGETTGDDSASD